MVKILFCMTFFFSFHWARGENLEPRLFKKRETPSFQKKNFQVFDHITSQTNKSFSLIRASVKGSHGPSKSLKSHRAYYILKGKAKIKVGKHNYAVTAGDSVFIPKNAIHSIQGDVSFLIVNSPAFDPKSEVDLSSPIKSQ